MKLNPEKTFRAFGRGALAWAFGLSVTICLISMWGRAIVVDTDALAESLSPMAASGPVIDVFTDWLAGEMVDAGAAPQVVDTAVSDVLEEPDVVAALDRLLVEVVIAAGMPGVGESTVDVATVLNPAAPAIARSISESTGGQVSPTEVSRVIDSLDPIVVRAAGVSPTVGSESPIAGRLGTATMLAFLVMVVVGGGLVATAEDRLAAIKSLLTRVSLGALSFAVMLRIGSWVLSPTGGRAPVSATFGALFHSKWLVPLIVGLVAGGGVFIVWLLKRYRNDHPDDSIASPESSAKQASHVDAVQGSVQDRGRGQEPGPASVVVEPAFAGDPTED